MSIFITLLLKLLPLYFIILLGYIAGKHLNVKKESIAQLLIYIIAPIIIFQGVITTKITLSLILLPFLFFILCCLFSVVFYFIGKLFWQGSEKNILAYTAGTGNTGYFGLPVVIALIGEQYIGIAVLCILGFILYENSFGFFMIAKGQYSAKQAFKKVLSLPSLYAFFVGLIFSLSNFHFNKIILDLFINFKSVYIVLGMMLIGLGLSEVTKTSFDFKFTTISFFAKFIVWPLVVLFLIYIDKNLLHLYNQTIYNIMALLSIVPLASNTVAFATKLNVHPEKAALTVLLSTIFALFYIPLLVSLFF